MMCFSGRRGTLTENSQSSWWFSVGCRWCASVVGLALWLRILRQVDGLGLVAGDVLQWLAWHFDWEFSGNPEKWWCMPCYPPLCLRIIRQYHRIDHSWMLAFWRQYARKTNVEKTHLTTTAWWCLFWVTVPGWLVLTSTIYNNTRQHVHVACGGLTLNC